jgi:hypothetical protein
MLEYIFHITLMYFLIIIFLFRFDFLVGFIPIMLEYLFNYKKKKKKILIFFKLGLSIFTLFKSMVSCSLLIISINSELYNNV